MSQKIAFIGLGRMGLPMALRLKEKGRAVIGYDVSPEMQARFAESGGKTAPSLTKAIDGADFIFSMLPDGAEVRQTYLGTDGILAHVKKDSLLIDCSTIDVQTARDVHAAATARECGFLDAPVSGGVSGAKAGSLTFMVGGNRADFDRAAAIFETIGKAAIHTGDSGSGQAAKICNNMMLAVQMIGVCEGFALAEKLGLAPEKLFEISGKSSSSCWSMNTYCPSPGIIANAPSSHDYHPGFTSQLMFKDLGLSQSAAETLGCATPLGHHATRLYAAMVAQGHGAEDFSAIIKYLSELE